MRELIGYIQQEYTVARPSDVRWSHAVNSREKLARMLADASIMMIESDIRLSSSGVPVAAHPPETESDLTFDMLTNEVQKSKKGLKLDFKDPEILVTCLEKLRQKPFLQPVLLNADVLQGNGANPPKFDSHRFVEECKRYYPQGILSIGWTTIADPAHPYTEQNVDEMLALCRDMEEVTFPVRACLLPTSWNHLARLTARDGYTLTIWNNEPVSDELVQWIRENTDPQMTYYDFIDDKKEPLRLI